MEQQKNFIAYRTWEEDIYENISTDVTMEVNPNKFDGSCVIFTDAKYVLLSQLAYMVCAMFRKNKITDKIFYQDKSPFNHYYEYRICNTKSKDGSGTFFIQFKNNLYCMITSEEILSYYYNDEIKDYLIVKKHNKSSLQLSIQYLVVLLFATKYLYYTDTPGELLYKESKYFNKEDISEVIFEEVSPMSSIGWVNLDDPGMALSIDHVVELNQEEF